MTRGECVMVVVSIVPRFSSVPVASHADRLMREQGLRNRNCMERARSKIGRATAWANLHMNPNSTGGQGDMGDAVKKYSRRSCLARRFIN
jgi:hypothetical protein